MWVLALWRPAALAWDHHRVMTKLRPSRLTDRTDKGKKTHPWWRPSSTAFPPTTHHVVCSWPLMSLRDVTWAARTSRCIWRKLVRFFRLRGYSIKPVWRLLPFRAGRLVLGDGGLVWGPLKPHHLNKYLPVTPMSQARTAEVQPTICWGTVSAVSTLLLGAHPALWRCSLSSP